jgi:hypothetical protein
MEHLTVEDLLSIAEEVLGVPAVRDIGLLDSEAHRPQASAFGKAAYSTIDEKAAALLEAVASNHALVDGNKRLAWGGGGVLRPERPRPGSTYRRRGGGPRDRGRHRAGGPAKAHRASGDLGAPALTGPSPRSARGGERAVGLIQVEPPATPPMVPHRRLAPRRAYGSARPPGPGRCRAAPARGRPRGARRTPAAHPSRCPGAAPRPRRRA